MSKKIYDNRELSWLKFNERVLEEAEDKTVPLLERLMFATIFQTNLDEFFMVRVGSIFDQMIVDKEYKENKTKMTSQQQLDAIFKRVREIEPQKDEAYNNIMQKLCKYGIEQVKFENTTDKEKEFLEQYFKKEIRPLIVPLVLDKRNPFPFLANKEIYAVVHLEGKSSTKLGIIPVDSSFERMIPLGNNGLRFMLIEDLILHFAPGVFKNYKTIDKVLIRVTRNADITVEEALFDQEVDFRDVMEELVKKRKKLAPVRIQLSNKFSQISLDYLCKKLNLSPEQIFYANAPLDITFSYKFAELCNNETLRFNKLTPQKPTCVALTRPMITQIKARDMLLSYPYESIKPFIRLLNEAATDKNVVSIKITLYRLAKNSQVIEALVNAAENGKQVLVLVELRARFDEENNIGWSKRLQRAGCTVIYGPQDLKVHSKLLLITRKMNDKVEYITQIGTGNYNEKTAALYTDFSLMTANTQIGIEANRVFEALSTGTLVEQSENLLVAPLCLQNRVLEMIDEEIRYAQAGKPAYIGLKLNSLTDKIIIDRLVSASQAGVKVDLLIRGICCLIAGVKDYTENITVTSIVGRFLEHSRIYVFGTENRQKLYISSADFMTRNTLRRVEVAVPILDCKIRNRIWTMFKIMLKDNVKSRVQMPDGKYIRRIVNESCKLLNSQEYFFEEAIKKAEMKEARANKRRAVASKRIQKTETL
ncbi:MAG: polyphosphate kinase 1 [Clostridiales bacterium]|jgi:polyphosphate kinase|nr:polyphosphate kinase 1 [Clostridiales bacterium]